MEREVQRLKEQVKALEVRTAQCQSDKIELMRDIATYENNAWGSESLINFPSQG
jgi:hypothetical protein